MSTMTVFRYDDQEYPIGAILQSRGDHFAGLTQNQKTVEVAIRAKFAPSKIRETSLYTWRERTTALRLWPNCRKKYLYELEIEMIDICFEGDLDIYSNAADAVKNGQLFGCHVSRYCRGEVQSSLIEILVTKAMVSKVLCAR